MERKDVQEQYKWDLTVIFPSDEAWEEEFKAVEKDFAESGLTGFQGKLGEKTELLGFFR